MGCGTLDRLHPCSGPDQRKIPEDLYYIISIFEQCLTIHIPEIGTNGSFYRVRYAPALAHHRCRHLPSIQAELRAYNDIGQRQ